MHEPVGLGEHAIIFAIEFTERMMRVVAVLPNEPEVRLPNQLLCSACASRTHDMSAGSTARRAFNVRAYPIAPFGINFGNLLGGNGRPSAQQPGELLDIDLASVVLRVSSGCHRAS
jgi:hypothetical protein